MCWLTCSAAVSTTRRSSAWFGNYWNRATWNSGRITEPTAEPRRGLVSVQFSQISIWMSWTNLWKHSRVTSMWVVVLEGDWPMNIGQRLIRSISIEMPERRFGASWIMTNAKTAPKFWNPCGVCSSLLLQETQRTADINPSNIHDMQTILLLELLAVKRTPST